MGKPSRKKFQEALRVLKQACRNDKLPFTLRIRAAELICCIYGVRLPESTHRTKRTVRKLVTEGQFDRGVRKQVQENSQQEAIAAARAFLTKAGTAERKDDQGN